MNNNTEDLQSVLNITKALWRYITPLLMFPGSIGNVICVITLQTRSFRGSATAFLLTALAVVDTVSLLVGAMHVWLTHVANIEVRTQSDPACRIHSFLTYMSVQLSAWTLVLVTLERVVSVLCPMEALTLCSRRRLTIAWFIVCFILACINTFLYLANMEFQEEFIEVGNTTYHIKDCAVRSNISATLEAVLGRFRVWSDLILSCLLPAAFIFLGNALVMYKLAEMARRKKQMQGNRNRSGSCKQNSRRKKNSSKITVMLVTVCVVFLLTSLPINIFLLGENKWFEGRQRDLMVLARRELVYAVLSLIYYVNNAFNFVLYFISGPMFRNAAIELFCPFWSKRRLDDFSMRRRTTHTALKAETTL